jgi:hypothetical protein
MAQTSRLMATGIPAAVARQLGSTDPSLTIAATGTDQGSAALVTGSYVFIFPVAATTPAPGVRLQPSGGAAQTVLYNGDGADPANIYPAVGEILNSWPADTPLKLAAGGAVIAIPGPRGWICVVQSAPATQGP